MNSFARNGVTLIQILKAPLSQGLRAVVLADYMLLTWQACWSCAALSSPSQCTHRREMGVDKMAGLRPAVELGCLRGWEPFCLDSLNIVILLSQQRSAFDGTCQFPPECGGWSSPLVRQLSAPQSPESL